MLLEGQAGPQIVSDGSINAVRLLKDSSAATSDANPRYYEPTYRQYMFFGATPSGQTTTVGLATTYVGLCLSNPIGNNKNLVLLKVGISESVINTAVNTYGLLVGYNASTNVTHTTPVTTLGSSFINGTAPTAKLDTAATLTGTPVYHSFFATNPTAVTNAAQFVDMEGSIIVPPGAYVATAAIAACAAASFWASFSWLEIGV